MIMSIFTTSWNLQFLYTNTRFTYRTICISATLWFCTIMCYTVSTLATVCTNATTCMAGSWPALIIVTILISITVIIYLAVRWTDTLDSMFFCFTLYTLLRPDAILYGGFWFHDKKAMVGEIKLSMFLCYFL